MFQFLKEQNSKSSSLVIRTDTFDKIQGAIAVLVSNRSNSFFSFGGMKKIIRKLAKSILILSLAMIILAGIYLSFLRIKWQSSEEFRSLKPLTAKIKKADKLPESVFIAAEKVFPGITEENYNAHLTKQLLGFHYTPPCPAQNLSIIHFYRSEGNENQFEHKINAAFNMQQLDIVFTPKEMLNYDLNNFDFNFDQKGISVAAMFYFHKNLNQLSEEEMIRLLIIYENSSKYNPILNPSIADRKYKQVISN